MNTTRLPGVYFETVVPPATGTLPRMDIAAFVGFAPSGPLDVPLAIEDADGRLVPDRRGPTFQVPEFVCGEFSSLDKPGRLRGAGRRLIG